MRAADTQPQDAQLLWIYGLERIGQSIAREKPEAVRQKLLDHLVAGFKAASGSISLMNEERTALTLVAASGSAANFIGKVIAPGEGVLGWVAQEKQPLLLNGEISQDPRFRNLAKLTQRGDGESPASALCWPLLVENRFTGALSINRSRGQAPFTEEDMKRGSLLVNLAAIVVENVQLHLAQRRRIAELHETAAKLKAQQAQLEQMQTQLRAEVNERVNAEAEQRALIAKLQDAQNQLLQSEKMAAIGQLAAGVAHEINNPVGYINSNLGTLEQYVEDIRKLLAVYEVAEGFLSDKAVATRIKELKEKTDLAYLLSDIGSVLKESQEGVQRVKKIVQDLKDFSRTDEAEWQWADLHRGLDSTLNIVHNEIKYKAEVVKDYGTLPSVECLASQLNQVFMNLLVNAAHAIEKRGTITLRTGADADWAWVEVADTGCGIKPEHLKRIFDPFFTTKPVGKGTGLGLSLAYGIVGKHGGRIEVKSELGKGSAFRVWLPVKQKESKADAPAKAVAASR